MADLRALTGSCAIVAQTPDVVHVRENVTAYPWQNVLGQ
jgi:hypothetical protein